MTAATARRKLKRVLALLSADFGRPARRRHGSPVAVLVGTILSQNTSDANSGAGFRRLWRRFRSWSAVADAPVGEIAECIRVSGLSRIKAPRIKRILRQIRDRGQDGRVSLRFLHDWDDQAACEYLLGFDGVGPKTAACVLLFALDRKVFPVDTHVRRVATRLGLLRPGTAAEKAHRVLTPWIAPSDRYAMHLLLIAHGRTVCWARSPRCHGCSLLRLCPYGRRAARGRRPVA